MLRNILNSQFSKILCGSAMLEGLGAQRILQVMPVSQTTISAGITCVSRRRLSKDTVSGATTFPLAQLGLIDAYSSKVKLSFFCC